VMMIEDRNGGFVFHLYNFQLMTDFHTTAVCIAWQKERGEKRELSGLAGEKKKKVKTSQIAFSDFFLRIF